ncbi:MAG: hypothetical protein FJZ60_02225 [Chlamydiae bacterium]|nr:hypothetical protein [Chlamydiota bacterium]
MNDKLTISDFGIDQSQQFELTKQLAPQEFLQEAKSIYSRTNAPIKKGVFLSELDTLFETRIVNRPFADFSFPDRIQQAFLMMNPAQSMQTMQTPDMIQRLKDTVDSTQKEGDTGKEDLSGSLDIVLSYCKDAQFLRNAVVGVGKG